MFYNEQKKHVRTKKEILDDSGNVRKGCKIIKKCEIYERTLFTAKNKLFKADTPFVLETPQKTLEDLVLPEVTRQQIDSLLQKVKLHQVLYEKIGRAHV